MLSWVSSSFSCCICTIYWSVVTCNVEVNNMLKKQHRIKIADRGQLHLWAELDGVAALWVHKIVPNLRLILCLIAYWPDVITAHKLMFWARSCFEPGFKYFLYQHPNDHNYNTAQTWNATCSACYMWSKLLFTTLISQLSSLNRSRWSLIFSVPFSVWGLLTPRILNAETWMTWTVSVLCDISI